MGEGAARRSVTAQGIALVLVAACAVLGIVGLVLPIIPGLLFLAAAAVIAARRFPAIEARLRRHRGMDRHIDRADRFCRARPSAQIKVLGLLCVKLLLDGIAALVAGAGKLRRALGMRAA